MQSNDRFVYLYRRYITKRYTAAEKDEFMDYLRQPEYDALLRALLTETQQQTAPEYEQPAKSADAIFHAIMVHDRRQVAAPRRINTHLLRYAAVALLAVATGLGVWYTARRSATAPATLASRPVPVTPAAEHSYIALPDGSKVLLNNGSHLYYPPAFNGRTREVYLEGEAYFDVHHNPNKPFIVHTGKVRTEVLGTAFNIRAFRGPENIVVTVSRGKVLVRNGNTTLGVLTRDEQFTIKDKAGSPAKQLVKTDEVMRWKADDILFDDITVREAVEELEKHFAVDITLGNPDLGNCRVTASFLHRESPEQIIKVITGINHIQYRMVAENSFVLSGEGCR